MKNIIFLLSIFILLTSKIKALPIENWRFFLFKVSSDFELSSSSPSDMFWDQIDSSKMFNPYLCLSQEKLKSNHLFIEPSIDLGVKYKKNVSTKEAYFFHGDLYAEVKYKNILVAEGLDVDTRYKLDSFYPAHKDRFIAGRMETAFLQTDWRYGFLRIGRLPRIWGPFPDRSLIISNNPYSYDAIELQLKGSFFEFRHLFAPFAILRSSLDSDNGTSLDRYLTAHSLNLFWDKWISIGITEAVLFTRDKSFPDLQYLNPISFYSVVNTNQEGGGNLLLALQWKIHPFIESIYIKGQLLVDDFQVDKKIITDYEPNHWGADIGIYWLNPLKKMEFSHLLKAKFTYASEWLYTVSDNNANNGERYIHYGKSLGLPFNDGYNLSITSVLCPHNIGAFSISFLYTLRGGNNELTSWQDSKNIPELPVSWNFPEEKRASVVLESSLYLKKYISMYLKGDIGWVKNLNNQNTDKYIFDPRCCFNLNLHFSDFIIEFK